MSENNQKEIFKAKPDTGSKPAVEPVQVDKDWQPHELDLKTRISKDFRVNWQLYVQVKQELHCSYLACQD